jgi:phage recombination protein Bet
MTKTSNVLELPAARLPVAMQTLAELGLDANTWRVLTESIFPGARTADGILLAVRYCKARGLDPLKRPVHVVPMWSKAAGREVETVWPGIAEVQTTAARTGQWAGMDPPRFGPERTRTFQGRVKTDKAWELVEVTLTFPEWCEVTVYRLVGGARCAFTEPVFWEEAYARAGTRSELPTDMWAKRPRGQLHKCAKAASLRAAFPEEATYTAEEMAGKVIEADGVSLTPPPTTAVRESASVTDAAAAVTVSTPVPTAPQETPDQDSAMEDAVREQVARVVARARAANAWKQAEEYCLARFNGPQLTHALGALRDAQSAA